MKSTTVFFFLFLLSTTNLLQAQNTCCSISTVAPEITSGVHPVFIPVNQNTPTAVLSINASSDLPNVEYLITKRNTKALDGNGQPTNDDVIIGSTVDGVFSPVNITKHGVILNPGDTCDLTAIGYDLGLIQNLTDSLLNGRAPSGSPCCNLFVLLGAVLGEPSLADFCMNVNNAGINSGSDVKNISDVLTVFDAMSTTGQTSIPSMLSTLQLINNNGNSISTDCGGAGMNNFIPYGIIPTAKYAYAVGAGVAVTGQSTCCLPSTIAPEVVSGVQGPLVGLNQNTIAPALAVTASIDLPNTEYILTKRNTKALDQSGATKSDDVIIGTDVNGVFMPMNQSRYGISLAVGDTFDLTAIGYDLTILKTLTDSLLNGSTGGIFNQPCCNLFSILATALNEPSIAGFCDSVRSAGIMNGNDLNDIGDALTIFDALSTTGQLSVSSMISTIQLINNNGSLISTECGGTGMANFIPYGINPSEKYGYVIDQPLVVQELNSIARFMMYPNPASNHVQLHFTTDKPMNLQVNVYDMLGRQVMNKNLGTLNGNSNSRFSVENLTPGIYSVELTDGQERKTYKLTVK
jgi:hypothetical protein